MEDFKELVALLAVGGLLAIMAVVDTVYDTLNKESKK